MNNSINFQVNLPEDVDIDEIKLKLLSFEKKGLGIEVDNDGDDVLSARITYPKKLSELKSKLTEIQRKKSNAKDDILLKTFDDLITSTKAEIEALEGGMEIILNKDNLFKIAKILKENTPKDDIYKHYLSVYVKEIISNLFGDYKDLSIEIA